MSKVKVRASVWNTVSGTSILNRAQFSRFIQNRVHCHWSQPREIDRSSQHMTQFVVAATNHSALSSDKIRSAEIRSSEVRWDKWQIRTIYNILITSPTFRDAASIWVPMSSEYPIPNNTQVFFLLWTSDNLPQESLAVASIARDDPSTLPGNDPFPRAHWTINSSVLAPACTATAMCRKLGSKFET